MVSRYNNTFLLTVGDWSGDGHGKTEDIIIESNRPHLEVIEAHQAGRYTSGLHLDIECADYEEDSLTPTFVELL
jgi:hypothetical protein